MSAQENRKRRWLVLRLEAPLVAFGGVTIDHVGVTRDFPALSMLTGLLANALGFERTERERHQALQDRLIFAARREAEPYRGVLLDKQNVQDLDKEKRGWTTRGKPEKRGGGSLKQIHRRDRYYHPDALVAVVVTLDPPDDAPTFDDLAEALERPARPLFIGRKPCLPTAPILCRLGNGQHFLKAENAYVALTRLPPLVHTVLTPSDERGKQAARRALWPANEGPTTGTEVDRVTALADRRNWVSGLHGGTRPVVEGRIIPREEAYQ